VIQKCDFENNGQENNRPMGENSPNLVTLAGSDFSSHFPQKSRE
jgi:hypothetical protein